MENAQRAGYDTTLNAGIDFLLWKLAPGMKDPDHAPPHQIRQWLETIEARLSRERKKGLARHWGYDLNRHIALKAARDRLKAWLERQPG